MLAIRHLPAALSLAAAFGATPLIAQDWELLGTRQVSFRAERDVIPVTGREGAFGAIKLEVAGGNLEMFNIRVVFGDGSVFSPDTRLVFREGSWSRTIDLPGQARIIRRVEFLYRSELRRGRGMVRVYGREAHLAAIDPLHPGTPAVPAPGPGGRFDGWDHIGQRQVSFRAERDVISGLGEGRFRHIMLVVDDADLEIFNVRLVFGNGEVFSPDTRLYFREGSRSRVIDLPGDARVIRRIEFAYKSVVGGGDGRAEVHVYGQR
jgi:hypothetical protein